MIALRLAVSISLVGGTIVGVRPASAQASDPSAGEATADHHQNYVGTSLFVLASLIPDDGVFFFQLDYGRRLSSVADITVGANVYRYVAPMSTPWDDETEYPGHALSWGLVVAHQRYVWKGAFVNEMVNPLAVQYYDASATSLGTGFMLLCAGRVGYHFDFDLFSGPFYLEAGAEVSFWPVNTGVPATFEAVDDRFERYVFSPALQFGFRF